MYHYSNLVFGSLATPGFGFSFGDLLQYAVVIWLVVWKGLALWKSAREGSKVWFIILLVVNTLGILEILYLYVFSKKKSLAMAEEKK